MKIDINQLSIEEKIGQMMMVGMNATNIIDKIDDLILKYKIGGIILYKKNYNTYEELIDLINYIKKLNSINKVPLFIAIDQEGGRVNRMPKEFKNLPPAHTLAEAKNDNIIKQAGLITGELLNSVGINFNFAPVLDIKRFEDKHAIGDRAFSENIEEVTRCGIEYMKQLQNQNIISVIKHFPGHGATKKDSHFILPIIKENISKLEKEDMIPFKKAIENGAEAVLVSHLNIKNITGIYPASMSKKFIEKYLRINYNYNGLVVTDNMRMKGVQLLYGKNMPVKKAFEAGNDIIVFKYDSNEKSIDKVFKAVKKNKIEESKINESVDRILKIKEKYNINDTEIKKDINIIEKINTKIDNLNKELSK